MVQVQFKNGSLRQFAGETFQVEGAAVLIFGGLPRRVVAAVAIDALQHIEVFEGVDATIPELPSVTIPGPGATVPSRDPNLPIVNISITR